MIFWFELFASRFVQKNMKLIKKVNEDLEAIFALYRS